MSLLVRMLNLEHFALTLQSQRLGGCWESSSLRNIRIQYNVPNALRHPTCNPQKGTCQIVSEAHEQAKTTRMTIT